MFKNQKIVRPAILSLAVSIGFFVKKHMEGYQFTFQSIFLFLLYFILGFGVSYLILSMGKKNENQ